MNPDPAKRLRQRIETMNKLRGRPLTNVEKLANLRRAFDEEDIMDNDHAKRVQEHLKETPREIIAKNVSHSVVASPMNLHRADMIIEALVRAGYLKKGEWS